jgi:hypothetical protein
MGFWCLAQFARRSVSERGPWLWGLTAACLAASYTHYYGGVMAIALFAALLLISWRNGTSLKPIIVAGVSYAVLAAGLIPFIAFAFRHSRPGEATGAVDFVRMLYRLVGSPVLSVDRWALGLMLLGIAGLGILALVSIRRERDRTGFAILTALIVGIVIPGAAGLALKTFDAYSPSYNIWLLPGLSMFLTLGLRGRPNLDWVKVASASAACIALVWSCIVFAKNAPVFAHGPDKLTRAIVSKYGPQSVVVYENTPAWGFGYFPLRYEFGSDVAQDLVANGPCCNVQPINSDQAMAPAVAFAGWNTVIVARLEQMKADDLRHHLRDKPITIGPGPLSKFLSASLDWRRAASDQSIAFVSARVDVFVRANRP